jgi:hypothetical protein
MSERSEQFKVAVQVVFPESPTLTIADIKTLVEGKNPKESLEMYIEEAYDEGILSFFLSQKYKGALKRLADTRKWHFYPYGILPLTIALYPLHTHAKVAVGLESDFKTALHEEWRDIQPNEDLLLLETVVWSLMDYSIDYGKPTYAHIQKAIAITAQTTIPDNVRQLVAFIRQQWQDACAVEGFDDYWGDIADSLKWLIKLALLWSVDPKHFTHEVARDRFNDKLEAMYRKIEAKAKELHLI